MKRRILYSLAAAVSVFSIVVACGKNPQSEGQNLKGEWCKTFVPGQTLTYEQYEKKTEAIGRWTGFSYPGYLAYLAAVDKEATGALFRIFSDLQNPNTSMWYGSFTPEKGFLGEDDARGFRVITKGTILDANGEKRLVVFITFWTHRNGRLQLRGGPDGLRVRAQISPETKGRSGQFLSVSYQVDVDANGRVTALRPSEFFSPDGKILDGMTAAVPANGGHGCFFCHHSFAQLRGGFPKKPGATTEDIREDIIDMSEAALALKRSIQDFTKSLAAADQTPELMESFKAPKKTFVPDGMLQALKARCQSL